MTEDKALDLALNALEWNMDYLPSQGRGTSMARDAITAIKQARSAPVQEPEYVYTCNGCDTLYREDDVSCDCTVHGLMEFTRHILSPDATPPAQPAPVQEPVGCEGAIVNGRVYADRLEHDYRFECETGPLHLCNDWVEFRRCFEWLAQHTTPPAAQRQWVYLTELEKSELWNRDTNIPFSYADAIETKLKEKNNG
jgi:hypothetical protein